MTQTICVEDVRTQLKPIHIGKFTILVEKIKTIYNPKNIRINYFTTLTKNGEFINRNGEVVDWGSMAWTEWFSKSLYNSTTKDIKENWEIELKNKEWI